MAKLEKKDIDREYRKYVTQWLPKFVERLTIDLLCIKEKREIPENDWEVLETAFQSYYMGYCADFIPAWQPPVKTATQQGLFADNLTDTITENQIGMTFDNIPTEPKTVIENEKV
jgi:hypothetical protein